MNRAIWKFPLDVADEQTLNMPAGAKILTVQIQFGVPTIWAEVEPSEPKIQQRRIAVFGTGHTIPALKPLTYIGSVQQDGGNLIWHIYEIA